MTRGKSTCKTLKAIRKQIAEANDIRYEPHECHYEGPCLGTCPACEAEVRYLERELDLRRQLGRAVSLIGVSAGLFAACTQPSAKVETAKPVAKDTAVECTKTAIEKDSMVVGEVGYVPEELDTASFVKEQRSRKATPAQNVPLLCQEKQDDEGVVLKAGEVVVEPQKIDTTKIYGDIAEQMPMFPGGDKKLYEYLKHNLQYPPNCEEICTQGRVIVTFVVERDGSISHAKIVKSIHPLLDAEALRVVEAMPKWIPGRQNGVTVALKYTIPVTFRVI